MKEAKDCASTKLKDLPQKAAKSAADQKGQLATGQDILGFLPETTRNLEKQASARQKPLTLAECLAPMAAYCKEAAETNPLSPGKMVTHDAIEHSRSEPIQSRDAGLGYEAIQLRPLTKVARDQRMARYSALVAPRFAPTKIPTGRILHPLLLRRAMFAAVPTPTQPPLQPQQAPPADPPADPSR